MAEEANSNPTRVAYQGIPGAYSHQAAIQFFAERPIKLQAYPDFSDIFNAVETGQADYAILPIENALAGFVLASCDLLLKTPLYVKAEIYLDIHHCLLAQPTVRLQDITTAISHPQALAQCSQYLSAQSWQTLDYSNTAAAAQYVSQQPDPYIAAIASEHAAKNYALNILARDIANQPFNQTRFFVLSRQPNTAYSLSENCKTLLACTLKNAVDPIQPILNILTSADVSLINLQTRPDHETPWQYTFLIELKGTINRIKQNIKAACLHTDILHSFGQYADGLETGEAKI